MVCQDKQTFNFWGSLYKRKHFKQQETEVTNFRQGGLPNSNNWVFLFEVKTARNVKYIVSLQAF